MRNVVTTIRSTRTAFAAVVAVFIAAAPVKAAESWLQCEGNVVTSQSSDAKVQPESKPTRDVYAYNDETQHFFRYSDTRKTLDPVLVTEYGQKQIKWGNPNGASYADARWEGQLDRAKLALSVVRHEKGETMTWSETCRPTPPLAN